MVGISSSQEHPQIEYGPHTIISEGLTQGAGVTGHRLLTVEQGFY